MGSGYTAFDIADLTRRLANIVRIGTVATVDTSHCFATVTIGNITTRPLPWLTIAAGSDRTWRAPSVGEQVLILSQSGDLNNGVILCGIYTDAKPAPDNDEGNWTLVFRDGATIRYKTFDSSILVTGFADVTVNGSGDASVTIGGGATVNISGDSTVNIGGNASVTVSGQADIDVTGNTNLTTPTLALTGDMTATGSITATGDVIGAGISLSTHKHPGVQSGTSVTGLPV